MMLINNIEYIIHTKAIAPVVTIMNLIFLCILYIYAYPINLDLDIILKNINSDHKKCQNEYSIKLHDKYTI